VITAGKREKTPKFSPENPGKIPEIPGIPEISENPGNSGNSEKLFMLLHSSRLPFLTGQYTLRPVITKYRYNGF
jgi:hypothetical protein